MISHGLQEGNSVLKGCNPLILYCWNEQKRKKQDLLGSLEYMRTQVSRACEFYLKEKRSGHSHSTIAGYRDSD